MFTDRRTTPRATGVVILALAFSLTACAYGFAGGTGEPNDPYQVATIEDLLAIGSSKDLLSKHYVLVNDLDLDPNLPGGRVFDTALIAANEPNAATGESLFPFEGVLDGRDHTIRNLCVSREKWSGTGLIGWFSGVVKDLHLRDVRINGSAAGALVGFNNGGLVLRCTATGEVSGVLGTGGLIGDLSRGIVSDCRTEVQVRGTTLVGGLFGSAHGGIVIRCEAKGNVQGERYVGGLGGDVTQASVMDSRAEGTVAGIDFVGGLIGHAVFADTILRCGAVCEVTAERTAGGLIGDIPAGGTIVDCYARGSVAGSRIGGLAGSLGLVPLLNSYAACRMTPMASPEGPAVAGGLFGEVNASRLPVDGCFWDKEVAGIESSSGQGRQYPEMGLGTEPMQRQATFEQAGWDFVSTWTMPEGQYPALQWEEALLSILNRGNIRE